MGGAGEAEARIAQRLADVDARVQTLVHTHPSTRSVVPWFVHLGVRRRATQTVLTMLPVLALLALLAACVWHLAVGDLGWGLALAAAFAVGGVVLATAVATAFGHTKAQAFHRAKWSSTTPSRRSTTALTIASTTHSPASAPSPPTSPRCRCTSPSPGGGLPPRRFDSRRSSWATSSSCFRTFVQNRDKDHGEWGHMWAYESVVGMYYRAVVQPWVRWLLERSFAASHRLTPRLDAALAALAHNTPGVEFVSAGNKKRARALAKIRDDYLAPSLPFARALDPPYLFRAKLWDTRQSLVHRWKLTGRPRTVFVVAFNAGGIVVCVGIMLACLLAKLVLRGVLYWAHVGNETARVVDIARGSLVCDSAAQMLVVHELLMQGRLATPPPSTKNSAEAEGGAEREQGLTTGGGVFRVVRFKNGWADAHDRGYVQLLYNVRIGPSAVCEVQVTHRDIYQWRRFTHRPYKIMRAENAAALLRDLNDFTVGELRDELAQTKHKLAQAAHDNSDLQRSVVALQAQVRALQARLGEEGGGEMDGSKVRDVGS